MGETTSPSETQGMVSIGNLVKAQLFLTLVVEAIMNKNKHTLL